MEIEPTVFIVVAVFVLTILGVAYGLKTRKGSGINEHPGPGGEGAVPDPDDPNPGDEESREGNAGRGGEPGEDPLDQHGMR
jgi:hypothetical protein